MRLWRAASATALLLLSSAIQAAGLNRTDAEPEPTLLNSGRDRDLEVRLVAGRTGHLLEGRWGHAAEMDAEGDEELVEQRARTRVKVASMSYSEYLAEALPDRRAPRISRDVPYHGLKEELLTFPMRKPRTFNLVVATCKTVSADFVVQLVETRTRLSTGKPGRTTIDPIRSAAFLTFGFVYVGAIQWALIVSMMVVLAPHAVEFSNEPWAAKLHDVPGEEDLLKQVMIDNLVIAPFLYFPVFYVLKELVATRFNKRSAPFDALRKCQKNMFQDNLLSMLFWIPGDALAFAAPIYMRLPIDHLISFSWTMVLSFLRGADAAPGKKDKEEPPDCAIIADKA